MRGREGTKIKICDTNLENENFLRMQSDSDMKEREREKKIGTEREKNEVIELEEGRIDSEE